MNIWPWIAIALWLLGTVLFYLLLNEYLGLSETYADKELQYWRRLSKGRRKFGCLFWPVVAVFVIVNT